MWVKCYDGRWANLDHYIRIAVEGREVVALPVDFDRRPVVIAECDSPEAAQAAADALFGGQR